MTARPPRLDASALNAVFGRSRLPRALTREGRVALCAEVATLLLSGHMPSNEARLFVGGALQAWLQQGGNLERDFLKVVKPKSHRTAARIFQEIQSQNFAHHDEGADSPAEE